MVTKKESDMLPFYKNTQKSQISYYLNTSFPQKIPAKAFSGVYFHKKDQNGLFTLFANPFSLRAPKGFLGSLCSFLRCIIDDKMSPKGNI